MSVIATFEDVELHEVGGESFCKIAIGQLKIIKGTSADVPATLVVEGTEVPFLKDAPNGPFRKLDTRTFIMATQDIMSFYYVVFPKDVSEETLETANYVMEQLSKGLDATPKAKPAPAAATPAAADPAAASADGTKDAAAGAAAPAPAPANNPLGQFGGMLQGMAQRAAKDTALLGELAKKAAADTMLLAGQAGKAMQGGAAPAPAPSKP